ncbi:hypothetical protein POTOM_002258 [Populus tomentosa]|uniref:Uncharacterized protein n=1 Tax=Populus tomentosa TaxID=118781 RepID=A0A8X8DJA4_POPTO|nr:hypothetical protein POTOM_002258 [Populus tomentosa]
MAIQLENLVQSIKSKVRALKKSKKPYIKMDKSASVRVEIRSRKARKLIDKTLQVADRSRIPYAFADERKEMVALSQFDHVEIQSQRSIAPTSRLNLN